MILKTLSALSKEANISEIESECRATKANLYYLPKARLTFIFIIQRTGNNTPRTVTGNKLIDECITFESKIVWLCQRDFIYRKQTLLSDADLQKWSFYGNHKSFILDGCLIPQSNL